MTMRVLIFVFSLMLLYSPAKAESKGNVELKSVAEVEVKVKNEKGEIEVKRVDAAKANVAPGDSVIFTTDYSNIGKQPVTGVVITNPVPDNMAYLDKTAEGKGSKIEFSIDKGKTYGLPQNLKVTDPNGKERTAKAEEYTNIKWTLSGTLEPKGKGSVSFRAKVK